MADGEKSWQPAKISDPFIARLRQLAPNARIRVLLVLGGVGTDTPAGRRQSRADRQAAIEAIRNQAQQSLHCVDGILEPFNGQRLAERPNALGTIPIETTVEGVFALADAPCVKAILEDQNLVLLNASAA